MGGTGVVAWVADRELREELARLAAAAGSRLDLVDDVGGVRIGWGHASTVVLDTAAALRCAGADLPRRDRVVVLTGASPEDDGWRAAVGVGAEHVLCLPDAEGFLVGLLGETVADGDGGGRVVAVVGGRGGAGRPCSRRRWQALPPERDVAPCSSTAIRWPVVPTCCSVSSVRQGCGGRGCRWPAAGWPPQRCTRRCPPCGSAAVG